MVVARHGQTDSNARGLWIGNGNDPLNSTGIEQSAVLANSLPGYKFDMIISSDKLRSIQTADIITKILKIPVAMRTGLIRDRDYGRFEGFTSDQIMKEYGVKMSSLSREIEVFPSVEPVQSVFERAKRFVRLYSQLFNGKNVIVITHGAFIRAMYEIFVGRSDGIRFANCSRFILGFEGEGVSVLSDLINL